MKQRLLEIKDGNGTVYQFTYPTRIPTNAFVGYARSILKKVVKAPGPLEVVTNDAIEVSDSRNAFKAP